MYKGVGVRIADFINETILFHFHRIFKKWGTGRGLK